MKMFPFTAPCLLLAAVSGFSGEVRLELTREHEAFAVRATCGEGTHRLVWQTAESLEGPWRSTATGGVTGGEARFDWRPAGPAGFLRALPKATPGFLERLSRIRDRVRESWAQAALLEAHLLVSDWTEGCPDAVPIRAVFSAGAGTVTAVENAPGQPIDTMFENMPWLGSRTLEWPIVMELEIAESRLREAGFGPSYRALTLRQPVYPGMIEPYWIFRTAEGFVFVGTQTGSVTLGE